MAASFIPRAAFPVLDSLPRSYYLGHHAAGLSKMRTMLSQIDLIIECRDYRVPLTSHNPLFEESLAGRERMVVYTKKDLGRGEDGEGDRKVGRHSKVGEIDGVYRLIDVYRENTSSAPGTPPPPSCFLTSTRNATSSTSSRQ